MPWALRAEPVEGAGGRVTGGPAAVAVLPMASWLASAVVAPVPWLGPLPGGSVAVAAVVSRLFHVLGPEGSAAAAVALKTEPTEASALEQGLVRTAATSAAAAVGA